MRRSLLSFSLATAALAGLRQPCALAQTHVVKKPETVVRAVGVYEWTGDEGKPKASRLVPVALFIDGHLEDAGVYLARPVPLALETGTVFELENAGVPEGTLELAFARHVQAATASRFDDGWMGFGQYKPLPKPVLMAEKKSGPLSKIEVSGGKVQSGPKFANKSDSGKGDASKSDSGAGADDPDRPTMTRRGSATPDAQADSAQTGSGKPAAAAKPDPAGDSDATSEAERPTLRKRTPAQREAARKEHDTASVTGVGSLNDDPDRPSLHRGKPTGAMNDEDLPPLIGIPADLQQRVAISDAANRPEHNFSRGWADAAERASVLQKMQALAKARVAAYDESNAVLASKALPPASRPPASGTRAKKTPPRPASASVDWKDEVIKGYTLSYGGAPTYFYSASSNAADGTRRFVAVVAQQELSSPSAGDLKLAMASVTDEHHLDRTPEFRLVDAVDAEASNRASLLLELRAQSSRQFALLRVIGAEAQQTFVTGSTD